MLQNTQPKLPHPTDPVEQAIDRLELMRDQQSGGKWLENLTAAVGPHIKEWDITQCWTWPEWPDRETVFPGSTNQDIGIDVVAARRSDGRHIAIQCKSRRLENGIPVAIQKQRAGRLCKHIIQPILGGTLAGRERRSTLQPAGRDSPLHGRR